MPSEHTAKHHKVSAGPKRLRDVAGLDTAPVTDDMTAELVSGGGALNDRGELRIADTGLLTRGAN